MCYTFHSSEKNTKIEENTKRCEDVKERIKNE